MQVVAALRIVCTAAFVGSVFAAAHAESGSPADTKLAKPAEARTLENDYKAAKHRADVREKEWDRRIANRIKSICSGC
jgi:hypothetical protein